MLEFLKGNVFGPSLTRAGTFTAGWLTNAGFNADHSALVGTGITAAGFIAIDFVLAYLRKKQIERAAVAKVVRNG